MMIDGRKVACATCIKGHRASHCQHKDRQLIEIKKKGRPATQCPRCRELRLVRHLHVRCDCIDIPVQPTTRITKKTKKNTNSNLRTIAPKPKLACACSSNSNDHGNGALSSPPDSADLPPSGQQQQQQQQQQQLLPHLPSTSYRQRQRQQQGPQSCCSGSSNSNTSSPELGISSHNQCTTPTSLYDSSPTPTPANPSCSSSSRGNASDPEQAPPPTPLCKDSCCGNNKNDVRSTTSKMKDSARVRVITCRCGDSCACPGCDAHPSRAMKGTSDPYVMMVGDDNGHPRRQLSIAAICSSSSTEGVNETPSAVLGEVELCNCGSTQLLQGCSSCPDDYYQEYLR